MQNRIDALIEAAKIIMRARVEVLNLAPLHDKLCRVSDYLDKQAAELLNATGE